MDNKVSELLGKHPHKPMNALWSALTDTSTSPEFIISIVLRCGIECKATRMEGPMTGPSGLGISPAATPLILACLADRTDIVAALLKAGATANPIENTLRYKALHFAVANENCEIIDLLIKMHRSGGDSLGSNGVPSPLFVAVEHRCITAARALLTFYRRGVHATHPDWSQRSPLHDATKNNDREMAELLLEFGANPDTTNSNEETPLDWAIQGGFVEMSRLLISHGATMSQLYGSSYGGGTTPLHLAASKGTPTILQLLLDAGIDVQRRNNYHGQTALQCALTTTVFTVLAAETSDFNSTDTKGRTLMHTAAQNGNRSLVNFLIKKGVSASAKDNDGRTPPMWLQATIASSINSYLTDALTLLMRPGTLHSTCR